MPQLLGKRMACYRCLLPVVLALFLVVAGLASVAPAVSTAYARTASAESPTVSKAMAPVGSTGRLSSPRLVGFPHAASGTTPAIVAPSRFRTRDDVTFAADKHRSNLDSTVVHRSLVARSIQLASAALGSTETVQASFPAMSYDFQTSQSFGADQRVWPPDTQIGVGLSQVVEFVNSSGSIWSKSGQFQALGDLNDFFIFPADKKVFSISDPRVFYDSSTGIWFSSAMAYDAFNDGRVYLNVSLNSDPAGFWYQYTIESNDTGTLYDQPRLGLSDDKVVMSWDDYSTTGFSGSETLVLDKAELIGGKRQPRYWKTGADLTRFAVLPSTSLTATGTEYLVYSMANPSMSGYLGYSTLGVVAITGSPVNNNVGWTETFAAVPDQANTVVPPDAVQPNGAPLVATNDDRLLAAVWQNGILWVTANDGCIPDGDVSLRSCLRLFQLSTLGSSPVIQQSFDVGSLGAYLSFPSIVLDVTGNAFLGFSGSSPVMYPSFLTSVLPSAGGPWDAEIMSLLQPGAGVYVDCAPTCTMSPNNNRWGDYGGAAIDPTNPSVVWLAGEYAASVTDRFDWGTGIAEVSLVTIAATETSSPTSSATMTPVDTVISSATETATAIDGTIPVTATPTVGGTWGSPTSTPTPTVMLKWIDVPIGKPTVVTTVVGSLLVTIPIPPGEAIARIAVSIPETPVPIVPIDPTFHEVSGAAIVVVAVDSSGQALATLDVPITIAIGFRVPSGDNGNPLLAQIYTFDGGVSKGLDTVVTSSGNYGNYVATASTGHLSPFVIFAPPVAPKTPRSYLPIVLSRFLGSGW